MAEVAMADVKAYLGIPVATTTYDDQITAITALWVSILNASILPEYLADTTLEAGILHNGKLLCIAGQVQRGIPQAVAIQSKSTTWGTFKEDSTAGSSSGAAVGTKNALFEQGEEVLAPYMSAKGVVLSDLAISSTGDTSPEFVLDRYDTDGNITEHGTIGPF